jgi:predicted secreted protein
MADWLHGKKTVIKVGATDTITGMTTTHTLSRARDTHDVTPYGNEGHRFASGLKNATLTTSGTYDVTADAGPRDVLLPLYESGELVTVTIQNEGTGSGLPQDSFSAIVTKYEQTAPAADMVTWAVDWQVDGVIDSTAQAA